MTPALSILSLAVSGAQAQHVHLDIRQPTSLAEVLASIAIQADASIGTADPSLLRRRIRPQRFDGSIELALRQVLEGTGAVAVSVGPRVWRIVAKRRPRRHGAPSSPPPPPVPASDTIVVTGSKRGLRLEDLPASVTLIEGDTIGLPAATRGTLAIAEHHAALLATRLGPGRNKLFLRGIADSSFNGTSPMLVGQYLGDFRLTYAAPDPDLRLYDLKQVEILEGPQGELYGSGALGGIVRAVPNPPDASAMSGEAWSALTLTEHGSAGTDAGVVANVPLGRNVAIRVVGYAERNGGYIDDVRRQAQNVNGGAVVGGRATLGVPINADWSIQLAGIFQRIRNDDAQYTDPSVGALARASSVAEPSRHDYEAAHVDVSGRVAKADFHMTIGHSGQRIRQVFDAAAGAEAPSLYRQYDALGLWTGEARLSGQAGRDGGWLAGASFVLGDSRQERATGTPDALTSLGRVHARVGDATLFGQVEAPVLPGLRLTLGGRGSRVQIDGAGEGALAKPVQGGEPVTRRPGVQWLATPMAALLWRPAAPLDLFVRYAGGYRPGGITANAVLERFDADTIRTAEIGFRYRSGDGNRLRVAGSLATGAWHDVQADAHDGLGLPRVANVGDARVRSATLELAATLAPSLRVAGSGFLAEGTLHPSPALADLPGKLPLPDVARYGLAASLDYLHALRGAYPYRLGVRLNVIGPSRLGIEQSVNRAQGRYATLSATAALTIGRLTFSMEATNLLDARGNVFAFGTPFLPDGATRTTPLQPRSARLAVSRRF
ncbi:outer membrane receptor protein involved in Fe transport [Sphingomonas trueperi]|uniref:TonB-dependent receptor n=1 Tax=Sphingomonas trueperi TaxID=53317 RepID=UPI003393B466